jgi:uncharacterized membrane protein
MNTNPENYKWGLFYFNREDRRIFVPKINQWMGWTLNFANPFSYIILFGFFLIIYITSKL